MIWGVGPFERICRLEHHGLVKGLTWDPACKYLASQVSHLLLEIRLFQSDDKSVIVWNTENWTIVKQIHDRFEKSSGQSFFKRLCWSPDGSQISAVHAVDKSQAIFTASIISRDDWKEDACLVGHKAIIESSAYSPKLFVIPENDAPVCVCALGSQDGSVSVWVSGQARAPIVLQNLFSGIVFDLTWSQNGHVCYACSSDGSLAVIDIGKGAFGRIASDTESGSALAKLGYKAADRESRLPEYPEQLRMEKASSSMMSTFSTSTAANNRLFGDTGINAFFGSSASTVKTTAQAKVVPVVNVLQTQKITTGRDGRRRVQPVTLQSPSHSNLGSTVANLSTPTMLSAEDRILLSKVATQSVNIPTPTGNDFMKQTINDGNGHTISITAENNKGGVQYKNLARITCRLDDTVSWVDYLSGTIESQCASKKYHCAATSESTLNVWSLKSGRRCLPRMVLDSNVALLCVKENCILVVTVRGSMWLWDVVKKICLLDLVSIAPILEVTNNIAKRKVVSVQVQNSIPTVTLDNHNTFAFDGALRVWVNVCHPPLDLDQVSISFPSYAKELDKLKTFKSHKFGISTPTDTKISLSFLLNSVQDEIQQSLTLGQIEDKLCTSRLLSNDAEYRSNVRNYAQVLSHVNGQKFDAKIVSLLEELESNAALREEVVRTLCQNRLHQRLVHSCTNSMVAQSSYLMMEE